MPDRQDLNRRRTKSFVALVLAFVAGTVDIIGYISFGGVFTAHLTGNTVHMGESLIVRHWWEALTAGAIILTFFCGSMVGRTVIEIGSRRKMPPCSRNPAAGSGTALHRAHARQQRPIPTAGSHGSGDGRADGNSDQGRFINSPHHVRYRDVE